MPPAVLSKRVAHTDIDYLYRSGGGKTAFDFYRLAEAHGKASAKQVLDWGCGPGRVTTHLGRLFLDAAIFGADLDQEAIAWANANISEARFSVGGTSPPLPFEDRSFDVILGGSVFTHLTRALQVEWLQELHRLLKPGGLAIVSTLGEFAANMRSTDAAVCQKLAVDGFDDSTMDRTLDGVTPEGYYRATWQSVEMTREMWGEYLDVVAVEVGGFENYQDLWVLRRA